MQKFDVLQARLGEAVVANTAGSRVDHSVIALPSFSVGENLLSHYVDRIPALEHRYLVALTMLNRIDCCDFVFTSSRAPEPEVVDYYLSLLAPDRRENARARLHLVEVPDPSGRAVAAKLLDRPDVVDQLRAIVDGRPAMLDPWNVQADEVALAEQLEVPINGTHPSLWPLGFKSRGRRVFAEAGVPTAVGREDVRSVDDIRRAVAAIRQERPDGVGVVVKLDDSAAGDGNVVIDLRTPGGLQRAITELPDWFLSDLAAGGVVEELVTGSSITSPSVQIDLLPDGSARVLATHEQVLGGGNGQTYMGCRFPADPAYAAQLAFYGEAVGTVLGRQGARGRASIDFVAAKQAGGTWQLHALEINLRKGGTTHPYALLRNLVPGRYDAAAGSWLATSDGSVRCYASTDNLVDRSWIDLPPSVAIDAVAGAGLQFEVGRGVGVVLHMLSGLSIDGRLGLTAIGTDPAHAADQYREAAEAIGRAAAATVR